MEKVNLNLIPLKLKKGIITTKEAINIISEFVCRNCPVFGLHKYDEDFREDIILDILEKGQALIDGYDSSRGDFFTYLFYQIKSFVHVRTRTSARKNLQKAATITETISMTEETEYNYNSFNYKLSSCPRKMKVPYAYNTKITPEELHRTFENIHGDKRLLAVAIKSAYYITDSQVEKICSRYNLNEDEFFDTIQYCRNSLADKAEKKLKLQERRNSAYLHHKNLETQIHNMEKESANKDSCKKEEYIAKDKKYCKNWESLNRQLEEGLLSLRPTNKIIASLLGICERQVAYYITCIKNENDERKVSGGEN